MGKVNKNVNYLNNYDSRDRWLKLLWSRCCRLGSKPNDICGFKLANLPFPCDKKSDFEFAHKEDGQARCQDIFLSLSTFLPSSAEECTATYKGYTRATWLKSIYAMCCKIGSKPNGMCGFKKLPLPCDQADFEGSKYIIYNHHLGTCRVATVQMVPSSPTECFAKPEAGKPNAVTLASLYGICCKAGSKPNGICGLKNKNTATPCKSKAAGEFLPTEA